MSFFLCGMNSFNSTLVQLKVMKRQDINMKEKSFNSTLVQLKEKEYKFYVYRVISFNSTLVQLKVRFFFYITVKYLCFNSTLVQLKAVKNANKYTSKSMIYHPFILIFYKHLQSTFNS